MSRRHALVARLDNVGDVLMTGPAVRAVASSARVTYLTSATGAAAARLLPGVDEVVIFDAPWVSFTAPEVERGRFDATVGLIEALRVDEAIIFTSFHQSPLPLALMLRLARVPTIAATSTDYPGTLLDVRHGVVDGHEVEQSLALAATLGHHLPPGDRGELRLRRPLPANAPFAEPYVVLHPGASVPSRAIPPGVAQEAVAALVAAGWCVAVTGSAGESSLVGRVASAGDPDRVAPLAGVHDLAGLAGVLAAADCVVVGNTGPAHLAAAVGTPVVSVFAPVVPHQRWSPWGVPSIALGDQSVGCAGCRARRCPLAVQHCLEPVTAAAIVDAAAAVTGAPAATAVGGSG